MVSKAQTSRAILRQSVHLWTMIIHFFMERRAVSVEWPALYANWSGLCKLCTWICSNSCLATPCSTSFDMKLRPDTGREFFRLSEERFASLIRGVTTAVLKASGIHPSMSEQLTSFVRDGSSISMHSLIRNVSQGSNRQDFVGEVLIILPTASSETYLKTVIFGGSEGG